MKTIALLLALAPICVGANEVDDLANELRITLCSIDASSAKRAMNWRQSSMALQDHPLLKHEREEKYLKMAYRLPKEKTKDKQHEATVEFSSKIMLECLK